MTDSTIPVPQTAAASLSIVVAASSFHIWDLQLGKVDSYGDSRVIVNPHVAIVLVGNWWCTLITSNPPKVCLSRSAPKGPPVEQEGFAASLVSLINGDYNTIYDPISQFYEITGCGPFGIGCTNTYVGNGLTLRSYSGAAFGGPVPFDAVASGQKIAETLQGLKGQPGLASNFGINDAAGFDDTVFLLVYSPDQLANFMETSPPSTQNMNCPGPLSVNGTLPGIPKGTIPATSVHVAYIALEDAQNYCSAAKALGLFSTITPFQFATWATSHELDEQITDPSAKTDGWFVTPGLQIADPCQFRNASGDTNPNDFDPFFGSFPFGNFTRDSVGTVVAAVVDEPGGGVASHVCTPSVDTSIPPG